MGDSEGYYSALERNRIQIRATTWMDYENIMSQMQNKYRMLQLI